MRNLSDSTKITTDGGGVDRGLVLAGPLTQSAFNTLSRNNKQVTAYTDGSASNPIGAGGAGIVFTLDRITIEVSQAFSFSISPVLAELLAIEKAIDTAPESVTLQIFCDCLTVLSVLLGDGRAHQNRRHFVRVTDKMNRRDALIQFVAKRDRSKWHHRADQLANLARITHQSTTRIVTN